MDGWIFSQETDNYGHLAENLWKDNFRMFELTDVMRQKDDKEFALLLNRLREGCHTDNDIELLKMHVTDESSAFARIPQLFTTRREVAAYNDKIYQRAPAAIKVCIKAVDWVVGTTNLDIQGKVLTRVPKDSAKTMGLSEELKLVIDVPAEVTNNVNVHDGVINGSPCIVNKFDCRVTGSQRVSIIWVEFDDIKAGLGLRTEFSYLYCAGIEKNWTPSLEVTRMLIVRFNAVFHVKRKQFPLQLAAAKTIHKAQGSTLQSSVVHFGSRKNDHIHYVGLSRVTHLGNSHILNLNEQKISVSPNVVEEMDKLRHHAQVELCLERLDLHPLHTTKLVFFNIRSLHRHFPDLMADVNLLAADILALSETRLIDADNDSMCCLPGFRLHRHDFHSANGQRPCHGLALYIRDSVIVRAIQRSSIGNVQTFSCEIATSLRWVTLTFVYLPPNISVARAGEVLQEVIEEKDQPLVLAGDMNFDTQTSKGFQRFIFEQFGFQYMETAATSDYCIHTLPGLYKHSIG